MTLRWLLNSLVFLFGVSAGGINALFVIFVSIIVAADANVGEEVGDDVELQLWLEVG